MIQFRQRKISSAFIEECCETVLGDNSIALLGPRFGGKHYVHKRLVERLSRKEGHTALAFKINAGNRPSNLESVSYRIHNGSSEGGEAVVGNPLSGVSEIYRETQQPVFLLAANVDFLPQDVARTFLEQVRVLVEGRRAIAILSGELDFRDLVHGAHSEFNCADQYVLQGFDEDTFKEFFAKYTGACQLVWGAPEQAVARLWRITNGNTHVARLLINVALEYRWRSGDEHGLEITDDTLERALEPNSIPAIYWTSLLRRPTELIAAEPECWRDLELLLDTKGAPARSLDGAPGALELSGIAIRREATLQFASEFMERLVRRYFTVTRMADLYAQHGQWERAFERYARLDASDHARPTDAEDRLSVQAILQSLGSAMFAAAKGGVEKVRALFVDGVRYLLGFPEVSFWVRDNGWVQVHFGRPLTVESAKTLADALPTAAIEPGVFQLPESVGRFAVAAAVRSDAPERQAVVVLSGLEHRRVVSREHQALAHRLLTFFVQAYEQALQGESNAKRLETRNRHVSILNQIFDFLGGSVFDVGQILELTGNELLKLGYRRVMFSLVDARRERIKGVLDCPGTLMPNLVEITNYPLDPPNSDLQPYTIWAARTKIVEDVMREPLAHPTCRDAENRRPFAIVPILNRLNQALGTMHIEREDRAVPTLQEVADLELFGRQLARVLAQHERLTMIQKSLDGSTEPLMITNVHSEVVYANRTAAHLFGIGAGWQEERRQLFPKGSKLGEAIGEALQGHRSVHQVQEFGEDRSYRGEVVCDCLRDWRGQSIGTFVDVHDLRSVSKVLDALTKIGPAPNIDSALEAIFDAVGSFGYECMRLYVIDSGTGTLKSWRARGLSKDVMERFRKGEVILPRRGVPGQHSWWALDRREPILFHWGQPDELHEHVVHTDFGLEAMSLSEPVCPPDTLLKPGSYWLEVPLYLGDKPYGKISIDCDQRLQPEVLETMRLLVAQTSKLLLACEEREKQVNAREAAVREGLETSMSAVAHNLGSRLASLPLILARFHQQERQFPQLHGINEDFAFLVEHALDTINRTREMLSKITPRFSRFDLSEMIARVLHASLAENQYVVSIKTQGTVEADPHVLESALVELIQNSRQFAKDPATLRVTVKLAENRDRVFIEFADNGPGVAVEHKKRIFDEFFGHRPGMKRSTGLGLAFVRRALEAHGGGVVEDGVPGKGAHFLMDFPLRRLTKEGIVCVDSGY